MTTIVDYALLAGASYRSTRDDINKFPIPMGWIEQMPFQISTLATGFEARTSQSGNQIVISYGGTATAIDWDANLSLAGGFLQSQLTQAAAAQSLGSSLAF